jgi:hypothetical protein
MPTTSSDLPTESTPLLRDTSTHLRSQTLPPILPTLLSIQNIPETLDEGLSPLYNSHTFSDAATKTAFTLIVLLRLYAEKKKRTPIGDVWEQWSTQINVNRSLVDLEHLTDEVWTKFLQDYRDYKEIEDVLWLGFPLNNDGRQVLRGK